MSYPQIPVNINQNINQNIVPNMNQDIFNQNIVFVVLEFVKYDTLNNNLVNNFDYNQNLERICTVVGVYEDRSQAESVKNEFPAIRKVCSSTYTKSIFNWHPPVLPNIPNLPNPMLNNNT